MTVHQLGAEQVFVHPRVGVEVTRGSEHVASLGAVLGKRQGPRRLADTLDVAVGPPVFRISAEHLVGSLAVQRDPKVAADRLEQEVLRDAVGETLAGQDRCRDRSEVLLEAEEDRAMLESQKSGHAARLLEVDMLSIVTRDVAHRARPRLLPEHQRQKGRIQPARQRQAQRHVAHAMRAQRRVEQRLQFLLRGFDVLGRRGRWR